MLQKLNHCKSCLITRQLGTLSHSTQPLVHRGSESIRYCSKGIGGCAERVGTEDRIERLSPRTAARERRLLSDLPRNRAEYLAAYRRQASTPMEVT